jgi:hypothetical protein
VEVDRTGAALDDAEEPMAEIDVFRSTLRLPDTVCVLAPGPNGRPHYGRIPGDCAVIAVNKGVMIPDVPRKDIWMLNHATQDWFAAANAGFTGLRIFSAPALREARDQLDPRQDYYFYEPAPDQLVPANVSCVRGAIRFGTTVSGCAVQFAYNFGARRILLCGVDMSGDAYFDGTQNVNANHGEVWPAARTIGALARWLRDEQGVSVETLSETRLDVPRYRPAAVDPART